MAKLDRQGRNKGQLNSGVTPEQAAAGGKAKRKLPDLKEACANALGEEQKGLTALDAILRVHLKKAIGGDAKSTEILLSYAYGKPTQRMEHMGEDGGAISFTLAAADPAQLAGLDIQTNAD